MRSSSCLFPFAASERVLPYRFMRHSRPSCVARYCSRLRSSLIFATQPCRVILMLRAFVHMRAYAPAQFRVFRRAGVFRLASTRIARDTSVSRRIGDSQQQAQAEGRSLFAAVSRALLMFIFQICGRWRHFSFFHFAFSPSSQLFS